MLKILRVAFVLLIGSKVAFAQSLPQADAVYAPLDMDQVQLGQLLFYDPILSGNIRGLRHLPPPKARHI